MIANEPPSHVGLKWSSKRIHERLGPTQQRVALFVVGPATVHVIFEQRETWTMYFGVSSAEDTQPIWWAFQIYDGVMQAVYEFLKLERPQFLTLLARGDGLKRAYAVYLDRGGRSYAALGYRVEEFSFTRL